MIKHRIRRIEAYLNQGGPARHQPPRRLKTVQDLVDLLEEQVEAVRAAPWASPIDKARAIAYLAGVAHKAINSGILAARVEILETVLQQRRKEPRS